MRGERERETQRVRPTEGCLCAHNENTHCHNPTVRKMAVHDFPTHVIFFLWLFKSIQSKILFLTKLWHRGCVCFQRCVCIQISTHVNISLVLLWSCSPVWLLEKAAPCGLRSRVILIVPCIVAGRTSSHTVCWADAVSTLVDTCTRNSPLDMHMCLCSVRRELSLFGQQDKHTVEQVGVILCSDLSVFQRCSIKGITSCFITPPHTLEKKRIWQFNPQTCYTYCIFTLHL